MKGMNVIETNWNWLSGLSKRNATDYIALHHAAAVTCSAVQVDQWHKNNGWSGIGYHYFVRKDGTIYRGRPEWALGAHVSGMNNCSLGICAEGNYDIEHSMPDAQYNAILSLIDDIHIRYPAAKVVGHREIGASDCPGKYYPLSELKNGSKNESEELNMSQYEELKRLIASKDEIINKMGQEIAELKNPMIYNYVDENMPEYYRPTIQKLVRKGKLEGNEKGELMLTDEIMRILTIIDRFGLFD